MKTKVLLLEDDMILSEIIEEFLNERGFNVSCVFDGNEAIEKSYEQSFDIYLFDVKVPGKNGFDVLKELRAQNQNVPTIFITSLASIEDLSFGFSIGCDDYLRKPFELKELEIRIKTLLKRNFQKRVEEKIHITDSIWFDIHSNKLINTETEIPLSKKELQILKTLLLNRGEVVTNEKLFLMAWSFSEEYSEESLRTHIKNLRKYLHKDAIKNIRGQGYTIASS